MCYAEKPLTWNTLLNSVDIKSDGGGREQLYSSKLKQKLLKTIEQAGGWAVPSSNQLKLAIN